MSILSLTFHCTESHLEEWETYTKTELLLLVENLMDVEKYILSDVESEMLQEGKNTNLLLIFDSNEIRQQFIETELVNISERVESKFGENVILFQTFLNPRKIKL
ncbi:MAG: DUF4286 family protein [Cruoricaptor ignavus]|nr:DUF4286 family protein [Cruoricaptor ignavus]